MDAAGGKIAPPTEVLLEAIHCGWKTARTFVGPMNWLPMIRLPMSRWSNLMVRWVLRWAAAVGSDRVCRAEDPWWGLRGDWFGRLSAQKALAVGSSCNADSPVRLGEAIKLMRGLEATSEAADDW
jgi:hypothetical protein